MAADGRRTFELYYNGHASGFRIVDASGSLVLKVPIAGSGIFDGTTCLSEWTSKASGRNATRMAIDDAMLQRLSASGAAFGRVAHRRPAVTLPLPLRVPALDSP